MTCCRYFPASLSRVLMSLLPLSLFLSTSLSIFLLVLSSSYLSVIPYSDMYIKTIIMIISFISLFFSSLVSSLVSPPSRLRTNFPLGSVLICLRKLMSCLVILPVFYATSMTLLLRPFPSLSYSSYYYCPY